MSKKRIVAIIPARMASSRFPGKPLVNILNLPMVEHVRRRVLLSSAVDDVFVATCDEEIMDAVGKFGGKTIMTAKTHQRCTDRVQEAVKKIDANVIVIVQGDEPLFLPNVMEEITRPIISDEAVYCTSLLSLIKIRKDLNDVDIVKAVIDSQYNIMYFSRSAIPYFRIDNNCGTYRQTGISAFTKEFLSKYAHLKQTPLEIAESIDFLRILEYGHKIKGVVITQETFGVDRLEDIKIIEDIIKNNAIQNSYYNQIVNLCEKRF